MKDKPLEEAFLENTEVLIDQFISNDLVKDIPVFGTALKICKGVADISNRIFLAKISRFITKLNSVKPQEKKALIEKIKNNSEEAEKIGEVVLFILDKISDLEKAEIIAMIFIAYAHNQINYDDFRRLAEAVSLAFVDDLKTLINKSSITCKSQEAYLRYLSSTGLTEIVGEKTFDEAGEFYFEVTELGYKFLEAYRCGNELTS
ncbi:hypothetical protein [Nostoc sp. C110]|uniref:hypothetical protein n=1 Tax=Nostoc sp. C110 TaxID=3349876 RepID=UPI00370D7D8B